MLRSSRLRGRLDGLRGRFPGEPGRPSASVEESLDRLAHAVEDHLERRQADDAIADRLLGSLDAIPQGVVLADDTGQVVFRNQAASGFVAARHSEALVESAIDELIAGAVAGEPGTRTLDLFGPPRRALQLRTVPLPAGNGRSSGAFLLVEDISERQRLDAVRRDFVANISHELKTPVGALGVLAETLVDEDDPEVVARLAGRMQREAFRVAHTIDDLLQLSQIEAGELPPAEPVPVHVVLRDAVERTRHAADIAGVDLVIQDSSSRPVVVGDHRQLVSAVANLCENAVKYSDRGATVTVATSVEGGWVELQVIDEGVGIPAVDLERVFERFYRVDRARSRDTGGTGLGLAIVRHIVANHGGKVTVASREGQGSTFTLRMPSGSESSAPTEARQAVP